MTNFGILMEIQGIENPFEWSRELVSKTQTNGDGAGDHALTPGKSGLYYSPNQTRKPSTTSEGDDVSSHVIDEAGMDFVKDVFQGHYQYIEDFIEDMKKIFPTLGDDWGIYIPEIKYLSPEPLVEYKDLSLTKYPNVHFVGDALSARGITVSGAQAIYVAENLVAQK
jgi:hypothetical protein